MILTRSLLVAVPGDSAPPRVPESWSLCRSSRGFSVERDSSSVPSVLSSRTCLRSAVHGHWLLEFSPTPFTRAPSQALPRPMWRPAAPRVTLALGKCPRPPSTSSVLIPTLLINLCGNMRTTGSSLHCWALAYKSVKPAASDGSSQAS